MPELIAIQMPVSEGDSEENLKKVSAFISDANPAANAIVVLPELVNTGYDWHSIANLTQNDAIRELGILAEIAKQHGIFLVAGSIAEAIGDLRYNSSYVFGPDGVILGRYAKVHLFTPFDEDKHFVRGAESLVSNLNGVLCGVSICYDLRFPELYRRQTIDGAVFFAIPAVWPKKRGNVWRTLAIARAMEQQCAVVAVNRAGFDAEGREYGGSLIVDPWGNVLAEAPGSDMAILKVDFDTSEVVKARGHIHSLSERRPDVYKLDWDISGDVHSNGLADF